MQIPAIKFSAWLVWSDIHLVAKMSYQQFINPSDDDLSTGRSMQYRMITADFAVGPQPSLDELKDLKKIGFKSMMINRPEAESLDQPTHSEEIAVASEMGVQTAIVPVVSGQLTSELIEQFKKAYEELPKPIFAHCRSGPRSVMLWALGQKGQRDVEDIIRLAADAGFDVSMLRSFLED